MRLAREQEGMTQEQVCRLLDPPVAVRTLIRWEQGKTPIPYKRMRELALVYRVKPSELVKEPSAR